MVDTMRDTMCRKCFKWTHRLTPGGNGVIFCDQYCAYRYDRAHGTNYAFRLYHFIPYDGTLWFATSDEQVAWASLKNWLTHDYARPTMEQIQHEYKIVGSNQPNCITFKRGFWS